MKRSSAKSIYCWAIYLVVIFSSCRKDVTIGVGNLSNFSEIFDAYWENMNVNYVYWDVDTTDWDDVYQKYRPIFAKLDLSNINDVKLSFQYFMQMTSGLIDSHYYIGFNNAAIENLAVYPSFFRKQQLSGFHYPYSYVKIDTLYLDPDFRFGYDNGNVANGQPLTALYGTINNEVLYFSCNAFRLMKSYYSTQTNGVQTVIQYFFDKLSNLPSDIKGIIVDVRGNPGGDLADLNFFVGHFIDKPLHFGYTQSKSGNGRLDFTPWVNACVQPQPGAKAVQRPIVVLGDINSASLSEDVVMAIHTLPGSIFVGENTWGATGPLTENEVYDAGQFVVCDFLEVKTSSCKFKYLDGKIYEGVGFPPDIFVPYAINDILKGKDNQLEKALSIIH